MSDTPDEANKPDNPATELMTNEAMQSIGCIINTEVMRAFGVAASRITVAVIMQDGRYIAFIVETHKLG